MADRDGAGDRRARARPAAGRHAERRRGGQQLVPVPRRLRRDRRGSCRRRRLGARRRSVRARRGTTPRRRRSWSRSWSPRTTRSTRSSPPTTVSPKRRSTRSRPRGSVRSRSAGRTRRPRGSRTSLLGLQTVSVYKPIADEAGVTAAIALALRDGGSYEDAVANYQSPLASGVSAVTSSASTPPTARRPTRPTGDGVVPYFALVPIARHDRQHRGHGDRRRVPDDRGDLHRATSRRPTSARRTPSRTRRRTEAGAPGTALPPGRVVGEDDERGRA